MTVNELKNMNVKIRGYAMPDDNAPDFYTGCKVSEALEIMKEHMDGMPEEFYNYKFHVSTEDERFLFKVPREFHKVYLGENRFDLTKEMVMESLGILQGRL